jgi:hypothetical protein
MVSMWLSMPMASALSLRAWVIRSSWAWATGRAIARARRSLGNIGVLWHFCVGLGRVEYRLRGGLKSAARPGGLPYIPGVQDWGGNADVVIVVESYLEVRLDALRRAQNPDGGWGYFPGKQSWIEPTAWAALVLHGEPSSDRAWTLLKSWQNASGGWRPSKEVQLESWAAALCVNLAAVRGEFDEPWRKGVAWVLESSGVESNWVNRMASRVGVLEAERDFSLKAWPWKPGTASWVEPTAHSIVALKRSRQKIGRGDVGGRVKYGEAQLLDVRCKDGGWNYGSPVALGVDLPSYPETTALALLGLQGNPGATKSLDVAKQMTSDTRSPMARAWLRVALRLHGIEPPAALEVQPSDDVLITAIEALGAEGGHYKFLKTGDDA